MKRNKFPERRLLIYMYIIFDGNQNKILQEMLEHKLNIKEEDVDKYFKENKVLGNYITIFDKDFPNKLKYDFDNPTFVIQRIQN